MDLESPGGSSEDRFVAIVKLTLASHSPTMISFDQIEFPLKLPCVC